MVCCPPGSSVHGIPQARILEWVAISFSRGSSWPRDQIYVSYIGRWILYHWATREAWWAQYLSEWMKEQMNDWRFGAKAEDKQLEKIFLKNQWDIHYIPISIGQKFEYGLAGSFGLDSLTRLQSRCWVEKVSSWDSSGRWSSSQVTPVAVGRTEFLLRCWPGGFSAGCQPEATSIPCRMAPSIRHLTTWQLALSGFIRRAREGEE